MVWATLGSYSALLGPLMDTGGKRVLKFVFVFLLLICLISFSLLDHTKSPEEKKGIFFHPYPDRLLSSSCGSKTLDGAVRLDG